MAEWDVLDQSGKKVGSITLSPEVFEKPLRPQLFYEVVKSQLASRRAGTASTKNRSRVRGGGAKPWRQKGTGRARSGSRRSPLWVGGGVVFGPRPRDYSYRPPKKVRRAALCSALSHYLREGRLVLLDRLELQTPRTRELIPILKALGVEEGMFVIDREDFNLQRSARNIPGIEVMRVEGLNLYDLLRKKKLIFTRESIASLEKRLLG